VGLRVRYYRLPRDLARESYLMIAGNSHIVNEIAQGSVSIKAIRLLLSLLTEVPVGSFDDSHYRYKVVLPCFGGVRHGVFVDSGMTESELAELEKWFL
jgi:hypothetical protein